MNAAPAQPFGELLRELRVSAGLSQEDLAERSRLSVETISALERGTRQRPYRATVSLLVAGLELSDEKGAVLQRAAGRRAAVDAPSHNLPTQLSELLGRESDVAEIERLMSAHRLITVVGTGGIGKTRLAVRVGLDHLNNSGEAVWFVDFAPFTDPALTAGAIASVLGVSESPSRPPIESVTAFLRNKHLLLVLDNCEHIVEEAAKSANTILRTCPGIRIVATSREALHVESEQIYRLPSLSVPTPEALQSLDVAGALRYGAVALFAARATAAESRFVLTPQTLPPVAEICRRLDGIALAIELAAARVNVLSVTALAERLDERFSLLTAGGRTALPRQKTMRALLDWSYELLNGPEQWLLRRLSVFVGGFTLELAASVCARDKPALENDVLNLLASLVEKSLVQSDVVEETTRYRLLESTRQYAREKLLDRGEGAEAGRLHAVALLRLAERFRSKADLIPDSVWYANVKPEIENLRIAMEWAFGPQGDVRIAQQLAGLAILRTFARSSEESRRWIRDALQACDSSTPLGVRARLELAELRATASIGQAETGSRFASAQRALRLCEQAGDFLGVAEAHAFAAWTLIHGHRVAEGEKLMREALGEAKACRAVGLIASATVGLALARYFDGDLDSARRLYSEALLLYKTAGCARYAAQEASNLAEIEFQAGNVETALQLVLDAIDVLRANNEWILVSICLSNCAAYLIALNRFDEARAYSRDALTIAYEGRFDAYMGWALQRLAAVGALRTHDRPVNSDGTLARAAGLLGFVDAQLAKLGWARSYTERQEYDRALALVRSALGDKWEDFVTEGKSWSEDRAVAEAREI